MSRRRPRPDFKSANPWLAGVQILFLTGLLVGILYFRDEMSKAAGKALGIWGDADLQVEKTIDSDTSSPDAKETDTTQPPE